MKLLDHDTKFYALISVNNSASRIYPPDITLCTELELDAWLNGFKVTCEKHGLTCEIQKREERTYIYELE